MSRRIDIELTSRTSDGAYTWRAAGAKQPRGTVAAEMVPGGASVGDIVRAELESGLEGFEVVSVLPRQEKHTDQPVNRIEVLGAPRRGPDVVVSYAGGPRRRRDTERAGGRDARRGGPGRDVGNRRPGARRGQEGEMTAGRARPERRREVGRGGEAAQTDGATPPRGARREQPARRDEGRAGAGPLRRERRPAVVATHRNAMLATLGPQELPIAEQLLRGGIPAVRQALAEQAAKQPGGPATQANSDTVLSIAEQLLARVNLATWKDRATSAQAAGKELRLRELRAVVTSSRTVTLDDEARAMARSLHELLEQRLQALRDEWVTRMNAALDAGRVLDAMRVAARPPEPATRLPAELAVRLSDAAGAAMSAESPPAQWMALLEAVVASPVRRNVKPAGIPDDRHAKDAALRAAGSVPELAKLLGIRIPPPPPPRRPVPGAGRVMAVRGGGPASGR
jgi:hypothetical protein